MTRENGDMPLQTIYTLDEEVPGSEDAEEDSDAVNEPAGVTNVVDGDVDGDLTPEDPPSRRSRLVTKDGRYNVCTSGEASDHRSIIASFFADLFTTMVDLRWRYNILFFVGVFLVTWFGFAAIWLGVIVAHGDHLHGNDTDWEPCVSNVYDFSGALLFSIDLQSTMGYGYSEIQSTCPHAVLLFLIQCCLGIFVECLATAVVLAKLVRPKRRHRTIMFSRKAVLFRNRKWKAGVSVSNRRYEESLPYFRFRFRNDGEKDDTRGRRAFHIQSTSV